MRIVDILSSRGDRSLIASEEREENIIFFQPFPPAYLGNERHLITSMSRASIIIKIIIQWKCSVRSKSITQ